MNTPLSRLLRLSQEERRRLGQSHQRDLTCLLVQIVLSVASAQATLAEKVHALEARMKHRVAGRVCVDAIKGVTEFLQVVLPWSGVLIVVILWLQGKASLGDVQNAIGTIGTEK